MIAFVSMSKYRVWRFGHSPDTLGTTIEAGSPGEAAELAVASAYVRGDDLNWVMMVRGPGRSPTTMAVGVEVIHDWRPNARTYHEVKS